MWGEVQGVAVATLKHPGLRFHDRGTGQCTMAGSALGPSKTVAAASPVTIALTRACPPPPGTPYPHPSSQGWPGQASSAPNSQASSNDPWDTLGCSELTPWITDWLVDGVRSMLA